MNSWKVILATLVIFGAGLVTGGLVVNHVAGDRTASLPLLLPPAPLPSPESVTVQPAAPAVTPAAPAVVPVPVTAPASMPAVTQPATPWAARMNDLLRRMDQQLALQPEQRNRIEKIIVDSQERTRVLWQPILPQMSQEMQAVHQQIRGELNPNQRRKFEMLFRARPGRKPDDLPGQITRGRPGIAPAQIEGAITNPSPIGRKPQ